MTSRFRAGALALLLTVGGAAATEVIAAGPASAATISSARLLRGHCEAWVRVQTGSRNHYPTAMAHWRSVVARGLAHRGGTAPAGTLVFWNVDHGLGHVGISVGGGRYRDYSGVHTISSMPNYLGWAPARS
jgi:cell wall-associated NlpC family hydrolase